VEADPPGQHTWQSIWNGRFCPVVIYTAFGGVLEPPIPDNHPFVKRVVKGSGTEVQVVQHLQDFRPLVAAIDSVHLEIDSVLQRVLRDTVGAAVIPGTDAAHLVHAARRRVAALMDEKTATEGRELFSWEEYLVPALGPDPLTGDVLRRRGAQSTDPSAFRLILSPSCDLVSGRNESSVIVAKCSSIDAMKQRLQLPQQVQRAAEKVRSQVLTQGHWNGYLPLPAFPNCIPSMVATLKDLEVIQYTAIRPAHGGEPEYERVASIDSPFREQVAWAFLSTIARPGMPDRDLGPWAQEIATAAAADIENPAEGS
jgi:CTP synthase